MYKDFFEDLSSSWVQTIDTSPPRPSADAASLSCGHTRRGGAHSNMLRQMHENARLQYEVGTLGCFPRASLASYHDLKKWQCVLVYLRLTAHWDWSATEVPLGSNPELLKRKNEPRKELIHVQKLFSSATVLGLNASTYCSYVFRGSPMPLPITPHDHWLGLCCWQGSTGLQQVLFLLRGSRRLKTFRIWAWQQSWYDSQASKRSPPLDVNSE